MEMNLSKKAVLNIERRVRLVWLIRQYVPVCAFFGLIIIGSFFVSYASVLTNAWQTKGSIYSFWSFWFSAVLNTETLVLAGLAVFAFLGSIILRQVASRFNRLMFLRQTGTKEA